MSFSLSFDLLMTWPIWYKCQSMGSEANKEYLIEVIFAVGDWHSYPCGLAHLRSDRWKWKKAVLKFKIIFQNTYNLFSNIIVLFIIENNFSFERLLLILIFFPLSFFIINISSMLVYFSKNLYMCRVVDRDQDNTILVHERDFFLKIIKRLV